METAHVPIGREDKCPCSHGHSLSRSARLGGAVMVPVSAPHLGPPRLWEAEMGGELPSICVPLLVSKRC